MGHEDPPVTGALTGLRVLDFGQYLAGPLTAMMLADQGAEVIRIDPPGGPRWRHPANATLQRGKRSLRLDLKRVEDCDFALQLLRSADVLVENFRPGVMDRLGLGPETARALNPRLVYCSLPGFAANDPRAGVAAWEGVVGAAANAYLPPWNGSAPDPVFTALPLPSTYAAFLAATAIVLALYGRCSTRCSRPSAPTR
jgi:crotonobetainyl-CoA:carnitine CoA-transferase CaiB-like acyl-CoA transferase